jgi:hypothetical protein
LTSYQLNLIFLAEKATMRFAAYTVTYPAIVQNVIVRVEFDRVITEVVIFHLVYMNYRAITELLAVNPVSNFHGYDLPPMNCVIETPFLSADCAEF